MFYRLNPFSSFLATTLSNRFVLKIATFSSGVAESNLAKLRRKTGLAFTLCKKALELHNNDIEAATAYLKEESIKHGYAKAQKLKSRQTAQGLVGLVMDNEAKRCTLLEVNCETDFVARNASFRELIAQLTLEIFSPNNESKSTAATSSNEIVIKRIYSPDDLSFLNDHVSQAVTKLGENIKLARALTLHVNKSARNDLLLFGLAHASGDYIADINGVKLGKYGSLVVLRQLPEEERKHTIKTLETEPEKVNKTSSNEAIKGDPDKPLTDEEIDNQELDVEFVEDKIEFTIDNVGKMLCQQIIGMKPIHLKKSPEQLVKEKELDEKGYKIPEDNDYLLEQRTIVDTSLNVNDFCDNHGVQVLDFIRYECGESPDDS